MLKVKRRKKGSTPPATETDKRFSPATRKKIIFGVIFVCAIVFSYGVYQHYTTFSYNNIIRRINGMQTIPIEDLVRVSKEYPEEAPNVMRAAMANLIQNTSDPKEKLALQVQQYWEETIYIVSQPDGTDMVIAQDMTPEIYKEQISRSAQIVSRWDKYAPDAPFWRAVKDKRVLRFSRGAQGFSIPYPLLGDFEKLYPLPGKQQ
jgi:hypothetical protein